MILYAYFHSFSCIIISIKLSYRAAFHIFMFCRIFSDAFTVHKVFFKSDVETKVRTL